MPSPEHSDYGTSSLLVSYCLFCFSMFESVLDIAGQHSLMSPGPSSLPS